MEKQKRAVFRDDGGRFAKLPRECLVHLLSFTTPRDLCCSAAVSKCFLSAAESDAAWERFLPPDCSDILSQAAVHPGEFSSKKELYLRLCQPVLLQDGKMSFQLERCTGKKCYMISAEKFGIAWVGDPRYWRWISLPESRFGKAAELITVCWFQMYASINSRLLSQRTIYVVYIVFKLAADAYGLDSATQMGSINLGTYVSEKRISLLLQNEDEDEDEEEDDDDNDGDIDDDSNNDSDIESDEKEMREDENGMRRLREDGWLEVSLGEFYNDEGDEGEVGMSLQETTELQWKQGLILLGFELRPKATA